MVEKVWRAGEEKKVLALPSAGEKHSANLSFCRVLAKNTRQTDHFAECCGKTLGKVALLVTTGTPSDGRRTCRSRDMILPSVNLLSSVVLWFAESLIFYTRQIWFFTECNMYAECLLHYTRQISSLPSARWIALGKAKNTQHIYCFRKCAKITKDYIRLIITFSLSKYIL